MDIDHYHRPNYHHNYAEQVVGLRLGDKDKIDNLGYMLLEPPLPWALPWIECPPWPKSWLEKNANNESHELLRELRQS